MTCFSFIETLYSYVWKLMVYKYVVYCQKYIYDFFIIKKKCEQQYFEGLNPSLDTIQICQHRNISFKLVERVPKSVQGQFKKVLITFCKYVGIVIKIKIFTLILYILKSFRVYIIMHVSCLNKFVI